MSDIEDKAEEIKEEVETVAHNVAHPEDETRKEARNRQKKMPLIGAALVAIVLFAVYIYFFR